MGIGVNRGVLLLKKFNCFENKVFVRLNVGALLLIDQSRSVEITDLECQIILN